MSYGDFSASNDPEEDAFLCTKKHIPILPVRFSLSPNRAKNLKKPKSISNPGSYIVRSLRQGFVYIFVEAPEEHDGSFEGDGTWHVFRYTTETGDINSNIAPPGTTIASRGRRKFTRYTWTEHYGKGNWEYTNETRPYCWVSRSASKIWMAYSEYRWPPEFFEQAHDEAFRKKIMQPVDLRGTNDWAASVGDITEIVEDYKPKEKQDKDIFEELQYSQTGFTKDDEPPVLPEAEDCAALVSLFDPMGDVAEMHYRLALLDAHQKQWHAEHAYPMSTGKIAENMVPHLRDRSGSFVGLFNDPALREGWKPRYDALVKEANRNLVYMKTFVEAVRKMMADESNWMVGTHLNLAAEIAEKDTKDGSALEYYSIILGRCLEAINFTAYGVDMIQDSFRKDPEPLNVTIHKIINTFRKIWSGPRVYFYLSLRRRSYAFNIAFDAFAVELGSAVAEGVQDIKNWEHALQNGYLKKGLLLQVSAQNMKLNDAVNFLTGDPKYIKTMFIDGEVHAYNADGSRVPDATDAEQAAIRQSETVTHKKTTKRLKYNGPTADIPYVLTVADVEHTSGTRVDRVINGFEGVYMGFGSFMATWAFINAATEVQKVPDPQFEEGDYLNWALGRNYKMIDALAWMADAYLGLRNSVIFQPHSRGAVSSNALKVLYERAFLKSNAGTIVTPYLQSTRSICAKTIATQASRLSIVVAAVIAAAEVERAIKREDRAEIMGHTAMLIGGLMFLPGINALTAIGGVLIAAGLFAVTLAYDQFEDVMRISFWGSSTPYWEMDKRLSFDNQIKFAKNIVQEEPALRTHRYNAKVGFLSSVSFPAESGDVREMFIEEMKRLEELFWYPDIIEKKSGSSSFVVETPAIRDGNIDAVTVEVTAYEIKNQMQHDGFTAVMAPTVVSEKLKVTKQYIPGTSSMLVSFPGKHSEITAKVTVKGVRSALEFSPKKTIKNP